MPIPKATLPNDGSVVYCVHVIADVGRVSWVERYDTLAEATRAQKELAEDDDVCEISRVYTEPRDPERT